MRGRYSVLVLLSVLFIGGSLWCQREFKTIRKEIPLKKVKEVQATGFSDRLYIFHTKTDTGLYDALNKAVLATGVTGVRGMDFSENWIEYSSAAGYSLYALDRQEPVITMPQQIQVTPSLNKDLVLVRSDEMLAMLDVKRSNVYRVDLNSRPTKDMKLWEDSGAGVRSSYDAENVQLIFKETRKEREHSLTLRRSGEYLVEHATGPKDESRVIDLKSGKVKHVLLNDVEKWREGYRNVSTLGTSYFNSDFELIYQYLQEDQYTVEHFRELFDRGITAVEHLEHGLYLVQKASSQGFYDVNEDKWAAPVFDHVMELGHGPYSVGRSFMVVKEGKVGLFNSKRRQELAPKHRLVELRAYPDGRYAYRGDDVLYPLEVNRGRLKVRSMKTLPQDWSDSSVVVFHVSNRDGKLLVSLRNTDPEVEGASSHTQYLRGSGVLDLRTGNWVVAPVYHSITPYKGHYLAQRPGDATDSWTVGQVLDSNFIPVDQKLWGAFFTQGDRVVTRDDNWRMVEYDVCRNRAVHVLGEVANAYEDCFTKDGFLFIGHNTFDQEKEFRYMDVMEVVTPAGTMVDHQGMGFLHYMGQGMILVGRIPEGKELSGSALYSENFNPDAKSVLDLYTGKLLMPWCQEIFVGSAEIKYWPLGDMESPGTVLPFHSLRVQKDPEQE